MFVRELVVRKGVRSYTYLKVVENVWENGRSVQKTLANLGNVCNWPEGKLKEMVKVISRFLEMSLIELCDVRLSQCRQLGPYLALSHLWDRVGLDEIIAKAISGKRADSRMLQCAKAMTLTRLVNPCSKKAVWESVATDIDIPGVRGESLPLQTYYRTLERLSAAKIEIEKAIHQRLTHLFNRDVSVVFYDLTSAYFEGDHCSIAKRGYSKEHRPDLLQVEIGLLVDAEGIPIGHEVFDGNIKEVTTVLEALGRLREDFGITRCVFVGDDGIASESNLSEVERQGYEYITSLSLGHSRVADELVESRAPYRNWKELAPSLLMRALRTDDPEDPEAKEKAQKYVRYIGSYNPERARSSREHRRKRLRDCIAYLRKLQSPPKLRARKRTEDELFGLAQRYVAKKRCEQLIHVSRKDGSQFKWELDRDALRRVWRADGLLILKTNSRTLTDEEVAFGYRMLWRVEDAFRCLKEDIHLRPIRHWNDARVLGHILVCVLAYTLERLYDRELEKKGLGITAQAAMRELSNIITGTLKAGEHEIRRRSEITSRQQKLLLAAGVKEVPELW